MPDAARKLEEEESRPGQIYDKPGDAPSEKPGRHLHSVPSGQDLDKKEKTAGNSKDKEPGEAAGTPSGTGTERHLHAVPDLPDTSAAGSGQATTAAVKKRGLIRGPVNKRRRTVVISLAVLIASVVSSIVIFLALLPLKIEHIVSNLEQHFSAGAQNAVDRESNVLFSDYLKKYVLPGITNCKGTIDRTCTPKAIQGNDLVANLYRGWSRAKLENTLAEKYGLEFSYQKTTGRYFMKVPGMTGDGADITTFAEVDPNQTQLFSLDDYIDKSNDPQIKHVSKNQVRVLTKKALNNETKYTKIMYRFKVGRLLEEKYGIRRCLFACKLTDTFSDWKTEKKNAAKALFAERVIVPRTQMVGVMIQCLLTTGCDPNNINKDGTCEQAVNCESNGEDVSDAEKNLQKKVDALAAKYGVEDVLKIYQDLVDKGFTRFAIEEIIAAVLNKEAGQVAGQAADKALPVAGWINLASQLIAAINGAPGKIQKFTYVINTTTMVATYSMYRTFADEIKYPGAPKDATLVGSMADSLGPTPGADMGGTAGAEQAPLYNYLLGDHTMKGSTTFKCANGKVLPAGQVNCPEDQVNKNTSNLALALDAVKTIPGWDFVAKIAQFWNSTLGKVINDIGSLLGNLISWIPGVTSAEDALGNLVSQAVQPLLTGLIKQVITPISGMLNGGGTNFVLAAGGADTSGNDYTHNGLGGQVLSNADVVGIRNEMQQEQRAQYNSESFFGRMFDSSSDYSLVTKLAMAMPASKGAAVQSVASFFSNPFSRLVSAFGSIFSVGHVIAAAPAGPDPFGITQYGYTAADAIFTSNPEAYWKANCTTDGTTLDLALAKNLDYHTNVTINPDTQMPENNTTDPCMLLQASVGSDGAEYDPSLLTPDDLGKVPATAPNGVTPPIISKFVHTGAATSNTFVYNVTNASSCYVLTVNPNQGQQPFLPTLGVDFPVTAGNGGTGTLVCVNQNSDPVSLPATPA